MRLPTKFWNNRRIAPIFQQWRTQPTHDQFLPVGSKSSTRARRIWLRDALFQGKSFIRALVTASPDLRQSVPPGCFAGHLHAVDRLYPKGIGAGR